MPKNTFFNLPEHKKQTLIQAVRQEFSRVPLYQASITNIIKAADISRGSFYQYFEDKEDAFFYLLNEHVKINKHNFITLLKKNNGDLFHSMIDFFRLVVSEEEETLNFLKNIFLHMTYEVENAYARSFIDQDNDEHIKVTIGSLINKSNLNISSDKELLYIMQIMIAVTFRNFVYTFAQELSNEEAMNNYLIEINLLKNGLKH